MNYKQRTRDEHFKDPGPKRILSLDGGGVRGVLTLTVLRRIESLLQARHRAGDDFRLCHYFDLIAGTSTGAIIASALAKGMRVEEVQRLYRGIAGKVFIKSLFRQGLFRAKYDKHALETTLKEVLGVNTTLGSDELRTGLLLILKRIDSGSPWPLSNNPAGKYYDDPKRTMTVPNRDYPLWSVVRASTAAPSFFDPELVVISQGKGQATTGTFVDGGVSTANNPALAALRFVTLGGYRVGWQPGSDKMLLISVGTGLRNPTVVPSNIPGAAALQSLLSLMDDCNAEVEMMLQWMSDSPTARQIDREVANLAGDNLCQRGLLTYQRYNTELSEAGLNGSLGMNLEPIQIDALQEMDAPENVPALEEVGAAIAERVRDDHFPAVFDLEEAS